jgi:hypothetical protein
LIDAGPAGVFSDTALWQQEYIPSISYSCLILFLTGHFFQLSFTGTIIDEEGGRLKHYWHFFRIINRKSKTEKVRLVSG